MSRTAVARPGFQLRTCHLLGPLPACSSTCCEITEWERKVGATTAAAWKGASACRGGTRCSRPHCGKFNRNESGAEGPNDASKGQRPWALWLGHVPFPRLSSLEEQRGPYQRLRQHAGPYLSPVSPFVLFPSVMSLV